MFDWNIKDPSSLVGTYGERLERTKIIRNFKKGIRIYKSLLSTIINKKKNKTIIA